MAFKPLVPMKSNLYTLKDTEQIRRAEYLLGRYIDYRAKCFFFFPIAWLIMRKIKKLDIEYFKERLEKILKELEIKKIDAGERFYFQIYKILRENQKTIGQPPPQYLIDMLK
jgi:hypothetical protein